MQDPRHFPLGPVKVMATIGHVCLQWARLEMVLLACICQIEDIAPEKGELIFGGLDILPRVNMAIRLADYHKVPPHLRRRLKDIRKVIQDDILDRRNQIVHGAHREMTENSTTLTMVRWRGDKREKTLTSEDIHTVGIAIHEIANEAWSFLQDLAKWKFDPDPEENLRNALT